MKREIGDAKKAGEIDRYIATRALALRRQFGLSQQELAKRLNVSFQQIQKYEKGVNRIGSGRLFEIAQIFGVPVQLFYPSASIRDEEGAGAHTAIVQNAEFVATTDCWRVVQALMQLDQRRRQKVINLIEELASFDTSPNAPT